MSRISRTDIEAAQAENGDAKARPRGTLPHLPDTEDPAVLRTFLNLAFRPRPDWGVHDFERTGRHKNDPCTLILRNGREQQRYRFEHQGELTGNLRNLVVGVSDHDLRMPHLTPGETEDVWAALCALGSVLTEYDETDETRKWMELLLGDALPLVGYSLVPDARHDALMAMRKRGSFTRLDAVAFVHSPAADRDQLRRPLRFVDRETAKQWVRVSEAATYLRHVQGVEPLSYQSLRSRLGEIGVECRLFEDYRPPHPKLTLYQLTDELVELAGQV